MFLGLCCLILGLLATLPPVNHYPFFRVPLKIAGVVSTTELTVNKADIYAVFLSYPKTDGGEFNRALAMAEGNARRRDEWHDSRPPLNIQIRIRDASSGEEIFNQRVSHPKITSSDSGNLNSELARVKLDSGNYRVSAYRVGPMLEATPTQIQLWFMGGYRGK
ncbi:hypothetical protein D3C85_295340 [compost metagenome]